jgi:hypothetical protein
MVCLRCIIVNTVRTGDNRDNNKNNNNNNNNNNNVKEKVMPVIIGAIGTISKSLGHYLSNIPGKHEIKELQKKAILGTAHILQEVVT